MIDRVYDLDQRNSICIWIGEQIDAINTQLTSYIEACHSCVHPWEQPSIQIFATPLAQSYGLDALCNFQTNPISILIDVGRMMPKDWLLVVVHEYAHAHVGFPGHHLSFARSLTHLCLGLGIAPPPDQPGLEENLRFYPAYPSIQDPLAFWRGERADWRSSLTNSYRHGV